MPNKNQISWIALVAGLAIASTASARGDVDLTPCTGIAHPSQLTVECVDHLWKKAGCSTDIRLGHYRQYKSRMPLRLTLCQPYLGAPLDGRQKLSQRQMSRQAY